MSLATLLVIAAYVLIILSIGFVARAGSESTFSGFRGAFGWLPLGASVVAGLMGGGMLVAHIGLASELGGTLQWLYIGASAGLAAFPLLGEKLHSTSMEKGYGSQPEVLRGEYGRILSLLSVLVSIAIFISVILMQFVVGSRALATATGIPYTAATFAIALFVAAYLSIGGFRALIYTDVVQCLVLTFALLWLTPRVDFSLLLTFDSPVMAVVLAVSGGAFSFAAADLWQRSIAAKSVASVRKSFLAASGVMLLFGFLITQIGIGLSSGASDAGPDEVTAIITALYGKSPTIVCLLLIAAMMSTLDTGAFIVASNVSADIWGVTNPEPYKMNLAIALVLITCAAISLLVSDLTQILIAILSVNVLLVPTSVAWALGDVRTGSACASVLTGGAYLAIRCAASGAVETLPLEALVVSLVAYFLAMPFSKKNRVESIE